MSPKTNSNDLPNLIHDVWLRILTFCDIRTVLSIGQTCRQFHALAENKSVWLSLVRKLNARGLLDLPPDTRLQELSTSSLVAHAQRAVLGPRTWSPGRAQGQPPTVSVTHRLHPDIPHGPGILSWENEAELLPGGRYVLFNNWRILECWDVKEDRLIWTHESALGETSAPHVVAFAAEVVDDGAALMIVVCQRMYGSRLVQRRENHVEIVWVDLVTGSSHLIQHILAPNTSHDNPYHHPQISGDLVAIRMTGESRVMLLKPSTADIIVLSLPEYEHRLALIDGHLVITTVDTHHRDINLSIFSEDSLRSLWRPAFIVSPGHQTGEWEENDESEDDDDEEEENEESSGAAKVKFCGINWPPVTIDEFWVLVSETIDIPKTHIVGTHQLAVHESPMADGDEYVVWVCYDSSTFIRDLGRREDWKVSAVKFRLKLSAGQGGNENKPSMQQLLATDLDRRLSIDPTMTCAGHVLLNDWSSSTRRLLSMAELQAYQPLKGENLIRNGNDDPSMHMSTYDIAKLVMEGSGDHVHVSAYSGALTYSTAQEIVVNYYD